MDSGTIKSAEAEISSEIEVDLARLAPTAQNWKVTLSYDGTAYKGWQVQPNEATVQGELQQALRRVTGEGPLPQGSGRTDAGVHALGQVASFELTAPIPAENLRLALNRTLPDSIRILEAKKVSNTFHARHSAVAKTYIYRVYQSAICPPFLAPYVYACRWSFDIEQLNRAAEYFIGTHDFLSFAASDPDLTQRREESQRAELAEHEQVMRSTIRNIFSSEWTTEVAPPFFGASDSTPSEANLLIYRVRGNGFLHHMVRNLVGTMLDAVRGQLKTESIPEILAVRDRSAAGRTAPASGLFLHSVEYDGADESA
jgi:tRNA pseudouridine38-40 synthase